MRPENKKYILSAALIIILGLAVYANSLGGEFIWDDIAFVKDNEFIKSWSNAAKIFAIDAARSLAPGGGGVKYNFYRPLQMLTYMADYSVWGLNTFGYHFTNTILHILATLAIFWLIAVVFDDWLLALFAAGLFVVHPMHTEAVAFIAGRADSLSLLFMLLSFVFYVKYLNAKSTNLYILCLLSYIMAILSRESSAILPILLLLYHYSFKKKIKMSCYLSIIAVTAAYISLRLTMAGHLLAGGYKPSAAVFKRMPGVFVAIFNYIRIMVLPFNLHMEYGDKLFSFVEPRALLGIAVSGFLLIYALRKRNADRLAFFSIAWFSVSILPSSNLYPIGAYMAEHWLYLPSIGLFLILAKGLSSICRVKNLRLLGIGIVVILLAFYSYLTVRQNEYWGKLIPFYERTLKYNPESPRLLNNLGVAYHNVGENEKAIEACKKAIELGPDYFETHYNLGTVYHDIKEYEKAMDAYEKEIAINPDYPKVYNNLGALYQDLGRYEEAIASYKKAIELEPNRMEMHFNLALAYQNAGRYPEAITAYSKTIELNPDYPNAYNDLGVTYHKAGEYEKAKDAYKKAIELDPNNGEIYCNLGMANEALGKTEEAMSAYKKAVEIDPAHVPSRNNLAILYFRKGEYSLAVKHCDRIIELGYEVDPRFLNDLEPHRKY